jgi:hypothetical protein
MSRLWLKVSSMTSVQLPEHFRGFSFSDDPDPFLPNAFDLDFPDPFLDVGESFTPSLPAEIQSAPHRHGSPKPPPRPLVHSCPIAYPAPSPLLCASPLYIGKLDVSAMEKFQPRPRARGGSSTESGIRSDHLFSEASQNPGTTLNPTALGFIPIYFWPNRDLTFGDLVYDFFQRKNNVNARFIHKLYNALRISTLSPGWAALVGVEWAAPFVIRVNKGAFARLLGIKAIDGSLFHQQGNFTTHGFVELNREKVQMYCPDLDLSTVDFDNVRLMVHQPGTFVSTSGEQQVLAIDGKKRA